MRWARSSGDSFQRFELRSIGPECVPVAVVGAGVVEGVAAIVRVNVDRLELDGAWWSFSRVIAARLFETFWQVDMKTAVVMVSVS